MSQEIFDFLSDPIIQKFIIGLLLIAIASFLAIGMIIITTRKSILQTLKAAGQMMESSSSFRNKDVHEVFAKTIGIGESTWSDDLKRSFLSKTSNLSFSDHPEVAEMDDVEVMNHFCAYNVLKEKLQDKIGKKNVVQAFGGVVGRFDDHLVMKETIVIHTQFTDQKRDLNEIILSSGFRFDGDDVNVTLDDIHVEASRRAISDAAKNIEPILQSLEVSRAEIGINRMDLVTESVSDTSKSVISVKKSCEILWNKII